MGSLSAIVGSTVYLDTNILIYAVENVAGFGDRVRTIFERIDRAELRGVTSELSLAELLVKPLREKQDAVRSECARLLHAGGPLVVLPISRDILVCSAELRAAHASLKLPDAIHAATAMLHGCTTFLTNDARFEAVPGLPVLLLSNIK
ncbi:MAG: PIN domain-containing protein [Tepidisphaeraceae bacterium]